LKDVMIICNPASAGGRTGKSWPDITGRLRDEGLDFDQAWTTCAGEAIGLSRAAVREGRSLVVAAGGDGTLNEVANGFFENGERIDSGSRLGMLPMGTGGDFIRTLGIPSELEAAAATLKAGKTRRIDAGRVTHATADGGTAVRMFVNIADAGIGGDVTDMVNRGFKLVNGAVTFSVAALLTMLRWRNKPMHVVVDGDEFDLVAQQVVVANCKYYGGGMKVAPQAIPDDGRLDVLLVGDVGRIENLRGLRQVRDGTHLSQPKMTYRTASRVEVTSSELVRLDVDGEQPGTVPALFEVVPGALDVVCSG
jgi:YegS/Rv2252/BmrU family lipid kinase